MSSDKHKKYAVFTIDMERFSDTGCVKNHNADIDDEMLDGLDEYIRILEEYGIKSTIFTVGSLGIEEKDLMQKHIANGHEIALHSFEHIAPTKIDTDKFKENLIKSKKEIEDALGITVNGFRAPFFSLDDKHLKTVNNLDFKYDSSCMLSSDNLKDELKNYNTIKKNIFNKNGFYEYGLSCSKILGITYPVSGGGYLRLGNWPFFKMMFNKYIRNNDLYVFYLHPFELSKHAVPKIENLAAKDRYYLKHGFNTLEKKIRYIIEKLNKKGFDFVTFDKLTEICDNNL